jgi:2-phosphosulfolactate phosphatase
MPIFDQAEYQIRCEWGERGVLTLAPISDVVIIIDVLSFTTSLDIAVSQGAVAYPYRHGDASAYTYAESVHAEVAHPDNPRGYSLSPMTLEHLPIDYRMVLPSPNGSTLSLATGETPTLAGCLRNARSVADKAMTIGRHIAVIPSGERWKDDNTLRPSLEDWLGAGAIISYLNGSRSPEAEVAAMSFAQTESNLHDTILTCSSGKEKMCKDQERDIQLAADLNVSTCVPVLKDGAYQPHV